MITRIVVIGYLIVVALFIASFWILVTYIIPPAKSPDKSEEWRQYQAEHQIPLVIK